PIPRIQKAPWGNLCADAPETCKLSLLIGRARHALSLADPVRTDPQYPIHPHLALSDQAAFSGFMCIGSPAASGAATYFPRMSSMQNDSTPQAQRIGIPRETFPGEKRVATVPDVVEKLIKLGFRVAVEAGAGTAANFSDDAYRAAGAEIVEDAAALWA